MTTANNSHRSFPNIVEVAGKAKEMGVGKERADVLLQGTVPVLVSYPARYAPVLHEKISALGLIAIKGALSTKTLVGTSYPVVYGWNPEKHLLRADEKEVEKAADGKA